MALTLDERIKLQRKRCEESAFVIHNTRVLADLAKGQHLANEGYLQALLDERTQQLDDPGKSKESHCG
jgi:hypothetical protein